VDIEALTCDLGGALFAVGQHSLLDIDCKLCFSFRVIGTVLSWNFLFKGFILLSDSIFGSEILSE
jgi:hypothetical protein